MSTDSFKMLKKYFGDSTLSEIQLFEWHKAFSKGLVVIENYEASRPSNSVNDSLSSHLSHILVKVLGMKRVKLRGEKQM